MTAEVLRGAGCTGRRQTAGGPGCLLEVELAGPGGQVRKGLADAPQPSPPAGAEAIGGPTAAPGSSRAPPCLPWALCASSCLGSGQRVPLPLAGALRTASKGHVCPCLPALRLGTAFLCHWKEAGVCQVWGSLFCLRQPGRIASHRVLPMRLGFCTSQTQAERVPSCSSSPGPWREGRPPWRAVQGSVCSGPQPEPQAPMTHPEPPSNGRWAQACYWDSRVRGLSTLVRSDSPRSPFRTEGNAVLLSACPNSSRAWVCGGSRGADICRGVDGVT